MDGSGALLGSLLMEGSGIESLQSLMGSLVEGLSANKFVDIFGGNGDIETEELLEGNEEEDDGVTTFCPISISFIIYKDE